MSPPKKAECGLYKQTWGQWDQRHMRKSQETIKAIHQLLTSENIGFIPLSDNLVKRFSPPSLIKASAPYQIPSLDRLVIHIYPDTRDDIQELYAVYIKDDGMLDETSIDLSRLGKIETVLASAGITIPVYSKDEFKQLAGLPGHHGLAQYAKRQNTTAMRAWIRTPDKIGDIPIIKPLLATTFREFQNVNCLDPNARPYVHRNYGMGNNVVSLGMTVRDYIHAAYAWRVTRLIYSEDFIADGKLPTTAGDIPNCVRELYSRLNTKPTKRLWANEIEAHDPSMPFDPPDPSAYGVLTKVNTPILERIPENQDKSTFDRVRIFLGIKSKASCPDRMDRIHKHKQDIIKIALTRIARTKSFISKGVPIQYLKPVSMMVTRQDEIEILFELKI